MHMYDWLVCLLGFERELEFRCNSRSPPLAFTMAWIPTATLEFL